ncbi:MAG TPA: DUF2950 domain-containing protein [Candidatus Acidoferrum sp.]|nr:DUF2950 domain-containing protein [Candidatus Acidoferrum sp.]
MRAKLSSDLSPLRLSILSLMALSWLLPSMPVSAQAVSGQKTFSSPSEAVAALLEAARSGNPEQLLPLLGPQAKDFISSGDPVADKQVLARFVKSYDAKHSLSVEAQGFESLQVGQNDWPFPFPIVRDGEKWYFDGSRGAEEIIDRRIGRNELGAIAVCEGYVQSQEDYASKGHDGDPSGIYAQRWQSDPGKQNGLYWPVSEGEPQSPIGPLVAKAAAEGYSKPESGSPAPYHGYFYKILTAQGPDAPGGAKGYVVDGKMTGGFALIAYPAQYGTSGIMTFIVNQDGVIYQQDLGERTSDLASQIATFNPDSSWQPAQQ